MIVVFVMMKRIYVLRVFHTCRSEVLFLVDLGHLVFDILLH